MVWEQGAVYAHQHERPCHPSPFLSPASHSLVLTLYKKVAFCRSAPVLNASNPHPTLHSTLLPHSCNSNRGTYKSEISPQSFIRPFELQQSYTL